MAKFSQKSYFNQSGFLKDSWYLMRNARSIAKTMKGKIIPPPFRERLMLAVTEVNGCRYCSWAHTKMALQTGLEESEIKQLLQGNLQTASPQEYPALVFASHWADKNRQADADMRSYIQEHYSKEEIQNIELILRTIWWGNLCGNALDHLLHSLKLYKNK